MATRGTYTKVHEDWKNRPDKATPVYAEDMEHIEQGIKDAADKRALKDIYDDTAINLGRKAGTTVGAYSTAEGYYTTASGSECHAAGIGTQATNSADHAEGYYTAASGGNSHAEGESTQASEKNSHAEGYESKALGKQCHAEGYSCIAGDSALKYHAHAEGYQTKAVGNASHSEGEQTIASGDYSHAEGSNTTAGSSYSHAEGYRTLSGGAKSHSEGDSAYAIGDSSHAEGDNSKAMGVASHTEGFHTQAGESSSATGAHAEGMWTKALGAYSHAEGYYTEARGVAQHVSGKYNAQDGGQYAVIVGGGMSESERKNIHTLDWTGNAYYAGDVRNGAGVSLNSLKSAVDNLSDIAAGGTVAKVFDTKADLDAWLAVEGNAETLVVGQDIYIEEKKTPDYWWDGTGLQVLETDKVEIESMTYDETMAILNATAEEVA